MGENRDTTVIDAGGSGSVVNISKDNVTITGFTIQASCTTIHDGGIRINTE